jgi:hypothetical protein
MRKIPILTGASAAGVALALVLAGSSMAATSMASTSGPWKATDTLANGAAAAVTVTKNANGTGTLTVHLTGLRADRAWAVDIDGGKTTTSRETAEIAFRSGFGAEAVSSRTFTIHLTKAQMEAYLDTAASSGIVLRLRDAADASAAMFS